MSNSVRNLCMGLAAASLALIFVGAGVAQADRFVNANEPIVISDDITDRVTTVVSAWADVASAPESGTGKNNNGHGNNEDGVDGVKKDGTLHDNKGDDPSDGVDDEIKKKK